MPIDASPAGTLDIENATLRSREIVALTNMVAGNDVVRSGGPALEVYGDPSNGGNEATLQLVSNTANTISTSFTSLTSNAGVLSVKTGTDASDNGTITFGGFQNERLRITSDGKVGVGTNNPQYRLDVGNGGGDVMLRVMNQTASSGKLIFGRTGNTEIRSHAIETYNSSGADNNYMKFLVHDGTGTAPYETRTEVMTLRGDGNVGIGTASPSTLLDLKRDSTNGASIQFESSGGYKTSIGQKSSGVGDRALQFTSYGSAATSNPVYNFLALNDAANAYNKILTMLGNGNVGIGDESPSYKLDIPTGNQCFINGVRFFTFGSNTANTVIDSGIPMKGYGGGGSVLLFFSFHNSSGDNTRTDAYILRKSYDASWVSDGTSVHTICSLKGTNSQTGTLTFGFNGNHLTCSYSQGGAQNYYALSFDNF